MFETRELLRNFLKSNVSYEEIDCVDYELNGSKLTITFEYKYEYMDGSTVMMYDGNESFEVLDYMTWIFNECNNKDGKSE